MSSIFLAKEPALGYYYQVLRGLVLLLNETRKVNPCLSLECLDDIAIEDNDTIDVYQTKLHKEQTQMTDHSPDFWKTIRVWSVGIKDGTFNPDTTIFSLITTASIPEDSFLYLFFSEKDDDRMRILTTMETIATETSNQTNLLGYKAFTALTEQQKQKLISNIRIHDSEVSIDGTITQLCNRLELSAPSRSLDNFIDSVVGWWFRNCIDMLRSEKKETISKEAVNNYIQACRDQLRADALPDDFYDKVEVDNVTLEESRDKTYVKQLDIIGATKRERKSAISDYRRAYGQRSKWLRDGRVSQPEYDSFDANLYDEWKSRFELLQDDTEDKNEKERKEAGHRFYRENYVSPQYNQPLFRNKASLYITKGSYQMLSDDKTIGWHPDYEKLLDEDETVE